MEVGKVYKFIDKPQCWDSASLCGPNTGDWGQEFIVTSIGYRNFHYQVVGRKVIKTLNKSFWNQWVLGSVEVPVQFDSKLVFKFIR